MFKFKYFIFSFILFSYILCDLEFKGITYVGDRYCPEVSMDDPLSMKSLEELAATGANWIAIVVTEYQDYASSTEIAPIYENFPKSAYYTYKTETIEALTAAIKKSHQLGLKVLLKPHIDLSKEPRYNAIWRGDIGGFGSEENWKKWFDSYTKMILKYAKLGEELGCEMLSISCELISVSGKSDYWRKMIKEIREVYKGLLTASANHSGEEFSKQYWDDLDYIGVDAYYLYAGSVPGDTELDKKFEGILNRLEKLSQKFNRSIIITEIGRCSGNCRIGDRSATPTPTDHYVQGYFYERFLKDFADRPFIKGFFWWAWNTDPNTGGLNDHCITPQKKPAEYVLRKYYGGNINNIEYYPKGEPQCLCTI
jgi:hypothetical protein